MQDSTGPQLTIQQAARAAGVSASVLRLWERRGLLGPGKTPSGHRRYATPDVQRIRAIRTLRARRGFNLAAIAALLPPGDASRSPAGTRDGARQLGEALAEARRRAGLTLRQVARATGLAPSFVHAVEHGAGTPSVASLQKLARCYRVTVSALTAHRGRRAAKVIRAGRYRRLPPLGDGVTIEQLAEGRCAMDCHRYTVEPGASSQGSYAHEGEEFIHVLSGEFEIVLEDRHRHRLRAGDSMYFRSTALHAWANPGSEAAVLLWINTPPTF